MKQFLFAGVALAALTVGAQAADLGYNPITAKPATQSVSGDLQIYGGFFHVRDSDDDTKTGSVVGGLARANVWLSPGLSAQFDVFGESAAFTDDGGFGPSIVDVAGHLSWRNPGYLLGGMISIGSASGARAATFAVEGQTYMGPFLLYGQAGFSTLLVDSSSAPDAFYVHGEARYYINPNFLVEGNLGFASINSGSDDATLIRWGLDGEYKFASSPFGLTAAYKGDRGSANGFTITSHAFTLGLKVHLNNQSLQSRDMAGATLKDFNPATGVNYSLSGFGFSP